MSYLALARKWRPRTFSQLVGQEHINKALINALNQQRLHHAYLFTGTRGVGKTSIARILAKALNCEQGISAEPCLQCDACTAIEQGRFMDLIEIDGASKTRVEDTRELLDNVQYAPTNGRFKIYLIDEVHMLSQHSFNALLKTLEEPPAHVKFILATTDPQKLPVTVLSRCLQFSLRHVPAELISQHLATILQAEQFDFEPQALTILAQAAQGSMRDALSLLDQAIASCDQRINTQDVKLLLGYTQQDYALQIIQALAEQNPHKLLTLNQHIATEGGHFHYVLAELLTYLHQMTVHQCIGSNTPLISPAQEVQELAQQLSGEDIQLFYQIALKGQEEIHLAPTLAIGFSMTVLRMLMFRPLTTQQNLPVMAFGAPQQTHAAPLPEEYAVQPPREEVPPIEMAMENNEPSPPMESEPEPEPEQVKPMHQLDDWAQIIPQLKLTGFALNAIENSELITKEGRDIHLRVIKGHQSLFTPTVVSRIEAALTDYYQSPAKIILICEEATQASPAQQKERVIQQKQQNAETALHNDPVFQQLQQEFSAELVKNSIVPLKDGL